MQVLTLALLLILFCLMMNWQSDYHKQQQTYLAMSDNRVDPSRGNTLVVGHQQDHILPPSSSLVDPTSDLSKDILGTETGSRANDQGGSILIGRESFICNVLGTEDPRYKRIAPGIIWIFEKIFFRKDLLVCPLINWIIHHKIEDSVSSFELFIDNDDLDPYYNWTVTKDDGIGKPLNVKLCLDSFDVHELQLF